MNDELRTAADRHRAFQAWASNNYEPASADPYLVGPAMAMEDREDLADAYLVEHPADDAESVTEEWLERAGFRLDSLSASLLLREECSYGAIVELRICPETAPSTNWFATLSQGFPDDLHDIDDHIVITSKTINNRGDVRRLCAALGIKLKEIA
jgi:hypothetical protein